MTHINTEIESEVRYYSRHFPIVLAKAKNAELWTQDGDRHVDFLSGAGALNYGHNHPELKKALLEYILSDSITHSLDISTIARLQFMESFKETILKPRGYDHRLLFPGPTGTNAVEVSLKLARVYTGRANVLAFTGAFHGMSLGALAVSASTSKRSAAGVRLRDVIRAPYDDLRLTIEEQESNLRALLNPKADSSELPAAFILETIQGEGGLGYARAEWLSMVGKIAKEFHILLIVDDIQAGCGRSGQFFSFERMSLCPDIICLSKSLSGYGLPLSLVLVRPPYDVLGPGEHSGTFRGNNHAFVTASKALEFWQSPSFEREVARRIDLVDATLCNLTSRYEPTLLSAKGRGLMRGIEVPTAAQGRTLSQALFKAGIIAETSGAEGQVLKLFPPLTIEMSLLEESLQTIETAVRKANLF